MAQDIDADLIRKLRSLADDLDGLRLGGPTRQQLADAPLLHNWSISPELIRVLEGAVVGHPRLGSLPNIRTSMLWSIDREQGWARTLGRFYRLEPRRSSSGS